MSSTRHNLDDYSRQYPSAALEISSGLSLSAPVPSKKPKFRPAISTPGTSVNNKLLRKTALHALPSFSTPGFKPTKVDAISSPTVLPRKGETIYISSDSANSSPRANGVKRTSSDSLFPSSPPGLKRHKLHVTDDKENAPLIELTGAEKGKEPNRALFLHRETEQKPQKVVKEANIINYTSRVPPCDYHLPRTETKPSDPENDEDLVVLELEHLKGLLLHCHKVNKQVSDDIMGHYDGSSRDVDVVVLKRIRDVLNARIAAIDTEIIKRQFSVNADYSSKASPSLYNKEPKPQEVFTTSSATWSLGESAPAFDSSPAADKPTYNYLVENTGNFSITITDDDEPMPASDDGYWDNMVDISMDYTIVDDNNPSNATRTPSSFNNDSVSLELPVESDLSASKYQVEIMQQLRVTFHLKSFRKNQLEAITAAMEGRDVFVLMPTGGGKSLCFQLPAVCVTGKTKGVTVVVSPLVALMKDQVDNLKAKGVAAFLWNSETSYDEAMHSFKGHANRPTLLYVTPEKLKESSSLRGILSNLYRNNELARFVIDEAHCISTWGQDFRNAYQNLGTIRDEYERVPIMALTGTANQVTIKDIYKQLQLRDIASFTQSFNRPNLRYIIKDKKNNIIQDIAAYISNEHGKDSGVIYCTGRDTCERVAKDLRDKGLNASHYHAKISTEEKNQTLDDWKCGKINIIVATIAFGMGIDKANVRFVIHYDLAKSLAGYYQETGRAGRDGQPADCILYYRYQDFKVVCQMIKNNKDKEERPTPESIERQITAARDVVQYCMNKTECRRVQLLHFFDEKFDKDLCKENCDNCADDRSTVTENITDTAKNAIALLRDLTGNSENVTLNQLQSILSGANTSDIREKGHDKQPLYGSAKDKPRELLEQTLKYLLYLDILATYSLQNNAGYHNEYAMLGAKAVSYFETNQLLELEWRPSQKSRKPARNNKTNTNPSTLKGKKRKVTEEDPIELYDDDDFSPYEPFELSECSIPVPSTSNSSASGIVIAPMIPGSQTRGISHPGSNNERLEPERLYRKMLELRRTIARESLVDEQSVFSDDILQHLSATCPQDYAAFRQVVTEDFEYSDANIPYGQAFLKICIEEKFDQLNSKPSGSQTHVPLILSPEFQKQFAYEASVQKPKPKSKFTPYRSS